MKTLFALGVWCLLFVLCWPLAILALLAWPFVWLLSLPFRLVGITFSALFAFLRALLMLPAMLPRFIRLPGTGRNGGTVRWISLENTIRAFFDQLVPGYDLVGDGAFRVIRDSDIEVEEEAEDRKKSSKV